ncbi:MAG: DUF4332 domain-containing protein, partial [Candidatus Hodarchaeota archaeon]
VFSYSLIREYYDHDMKQATHYINELLGYDSKYEKYIKKITTAFKSLNGLGVKNYTDLIRKVESKEKCEKFLKRTELSFEDFVSTINCVFRWILPHRLYLRELIDMKNDSHKNNIKELRNHKIRFNLDILEYAGTQESREKISMETGISKSFILDLVNLADLSRLPYSNRKTVKHLFAGGYNSVAKIAQTDTEKLMEDMKSYFEKLGVKLSGFIDLRGIARWAKTMPQLLCVHAPTKTLTYAKEL